MPIHWHPSINLTKVHEGLSSQYLPVKVKIALRE